MTELDIIGIGAWSECFANWAQLQEGLRSGEWPEGEALSPELIPPRERRRAPHTVKMAVEVLGQACEMAGMATSEPAVVFTSAMGDMDITDAMCRILADRPELVSPTRFHNSVHNAAIGYWSIATRSHAPATAVAGHDNSASVGLVEAAVQCVSDGIPVLFVCQEGAAPRTLRAVRDSAHPLALAMLFSPPGSAASPLARLELELIEGGSETSAPRGSFPIDFSGNPSAALLPLFEALADVMGPNEPRRCALRLAVNEHCSTRIEIRAPSKHPEEGS
jgi:hypothetical protein